jgi:hypothetical protein
MLTRKAGVVGLALTAFDIWMRIPPNQRRQLMQQARKHGPRIARAAIERRRSRRPPR